VSAHSGYETQPATEALPLLEGEAFDALVADIRANGLISPIPLIDGRMILDCRNLIQVCIAAAACGRRTPSSWCWSETIALTSTRHVVQLGERSERLRRTTSFGKTYDDNRPRTEPLRIRSNNAGLPTRKPILNCNPSLKGEANVY
jgi:hypothetical protein